MANRGVLADRYTSRNRRTTVREAEAPLPTRFSNAHLKAAPAPRPDSPPAPLGDLSQAPITELCRLSSETLNGRSRSLQEKRRHGIRMLFGHLQALPGATWQERWEASGFNDEQAPSVNMLGRGGRDSGDLISAVKWAFCARVIQPSLSGFRANKFVEYGEAFRALQNDPRLDAYFAAVDAEPYLVPRHRIRAKVDLTCALTTQGIALEHLTPSALLHYSLENRRLGLTYAASDTANKKTRFAALGAWEILHKTGHFPPGTAPTLRTFICNGQCTVEELVDRYGIKHQGVRQLLIDYLTRRRADTDYITADGLARHLAGHFWAKIEEINPAQDDLALPQQVYDQWRAELRYWTKDKTRVRKDVASILLAVRGLYVDLHSWAVEEPEHWGQWVAPCPILPRDFAGFGKRRREINRRMADRTRIRQPLLPVLVQHVESRHERLAGLLAMGSKVSLGEEFMYAGRLFRRSNSREDQRRVKAGDSPSVRVVDATTGELINVTFDEGAAFWEWAAVEVLRHSGIRIEELSELTQMSIRQYQRPNGEVIALLVVAPSKSDREHVIPMSADLFHAVAQVVRRHTRDGLTIPLVSRYDSHEKTWSELLPYLFQRQNGTLRTVMAPTTILNMLARTCEEIGRTNEAFGGTKFTPHDFRRLFATEIVNGGLPIHIGAALLGHLNLQTTQGYVAVFAEDVVRHYQEFLNHRRSLRPQDEYGEVTPEEWAEFEEHFDKRKVELGNCARPYGTPCQHEHACIRCPMLQVNPKMLARLWELEKDLLARRKRAEEEQ